MTQSAPDFIVYRPSSFEDYKDTCATLMESGMTPFKMTGYKEQPDNPIYVTYSPTLSKGMAVFTDGTNDNNAELIERCQFVTDRSEFVNLVTSHVKETGAKNPNPLAGLLAQLVRN